MSKKGSPHLALAHSYWRSHLQPGDIAIDATCGNGHDSFALANLLLNHPEGLLIGFDIQPEALKKTELLLKKSLPEDHLNRIFLHQRCHSEIDEAPLPRPPALIVYNLGYLPGADKRITTQTASTLTSLQKAACLIREKGAISVACYPGHPEGKLEEEALLAWAQSMPSEKWLVCHHRWLNRHNAPSLLWIQKIY